MGLFQSLIVGIPCPVAMDASSLQAKLSSLPVEEDNVRKVARVQNDILAGGLQLHDDGRHVFDIVA